MPANKDFAQYVVGDEDALSERSFRNTWKRICKKVNLPKGVTPHVLRHTFLTQLQATGRVDLEKSGECRLCKAFHDFRTGVNM